VEFLAQLDWLAVGQIILIDILLGGDNAIVIALACRNLTPAHRRLGILWGTAGAIGLRIVLTLFAVGMLQLPYVKIVGAALLLWIGVKLMLPENGVDHDDIHASAHLWGAVRTIVVADFVMSLDNVVAIAGAARGSGWLVVFGLLVSIPLVVWGSQLVLKLIDRYPVIVMLGSGLLGYIAGHMATSDPVVERWIGAGTSMHWAAPVAGAIVVVLLGKWLGGRGARNT
jgi:YjbE family integral membrane protein